MTSTLTATDDRVLDLTEAGLIAAKLAQAPTIRQLDTADDVFVHSFVNEHDNAVTVLVEDAGWNGRQGTARIIRYALAGPRSIAEQFVTEGEAKALHAALGFMLYGDQSPFLTKTKYEAPLP